MKCGILKTRTLETIQVSFSYRIMPNTATGVSPSELLMGCRLCSHLKSGRKKSHNERAKRQVGDPSLYVWDFPSGVLCHCEGHH